VPKLMLCLAVGLLLSFIVAWVASMTVRGRVRPLVRLDADDQLVALMRSDPRRTVFGGQAYYGFGCDADVVYGGNGVDRTASASGRVARAGWPCRCVTGTEMTSDRAIFGFYDAWPMPARLKPVFPAVLVVGFVPYKPIWSGLLVNTLCFAMVTWLTLRAASAVRSRRRRRRGVCEQCRYPLRGTSRCPECGWAASRQAPGGAPLP
jgi:hypothetical protein